ncbi:hypothetical protein CHS0354_003948, partial [Potamilus streckersoni]
GHRKINLVPTFLRTVIDIRYRTPAKLFSLKVLFCSSKKPGVLIDVMSRSIMRHSRYQYSTYDIAFKMDTPRQ